MRWKICHCHVSTMLNIFVHLLTLKLAGTIFPVFPGPQRLLAAANRHQQHQLVVRAAMAMTDHSAREVGLAAADTLVKFLPKIVASRIKMLIVFTRSWWLFCPSRAAATYKTTVYRPSWEYVVRRHGRRRAGLFCSMLRYKCTHCRRQA